MANMPTRPIANFAVLVSGNTTPLQKSLAGAQALGDTFARNMVKTTAGATLAMTGLAVGILGVAKAVQTLRNVSTVGQEFEKLETQLGILYRSFDKGREEFRKLAEVSAVTPFLPTDLVNATKLLEVFGGEVLNNAKNLETIGNAVAGSGKDFDRVTTAIGKMYVELQKGTGALGDGATSLREFGLLGGDIANQLIEMSKAGKDARTVMQAYFQYLQRFDGAMLALSQTLGGLISTLMGEFQILQADAFDAIKRDMKGIVASAIEFVRYLRESGLYMKLVRGSADLIVGAFEILINNGEFILKHLLSIYDATIAIFEAISMVVDAFSPVAEALSFINELTLTFGSELTLVQTLLVGISGVIGGLALGLKLGFKTLQDILSKMALFVQSIFFGLKGVFHLLARETNDAQLSFQHFQASMKEAFNFKGILKENQKDFDTFMRNFDNMVKGMENRNSGLTKTFDKIREAFKNMKKDVNGLLAPLEKGADITAKVNGKGGALETATAGSVSAYKVLAGVGDQEQRRKSWEEKVARILEEINQNGKAVMQNQTIRMEQLNQNNLGFVDGGVMA